jgi:hypothetical protein
LWEAEFRPRPDDEFPEHFASALGIFDSRVVVGQLGGDSGDGPVHVFERQDGAWGPVEVLTNPDPQGTEVDDFGFALALLDDRLYVTARMSSMGSVEEGGVLHEFEVQEDGFVHLGFYTPEGDDTEMGEALAVSEDLVVVSSSSYVYVFERGSQGRLARVERLEPPSPPEPGVNCFGSALALRGDWLAVGEMCRGSEEGSQVGEVHVYLRDEEGFQHRRTLRSPSPGSSHRFGASVGWDGSDLLVGEPGAGSYVGAVWRFRNGINATGVQERLIPTGIEAGRFGEEMEVMDRFVLIGAPAADRVYVYLR